MTLGNYRILSVLGVGGMGTVYKAEHIVLGREVAVKVLYESRAREREWRRRFLNEACVTSQLRHPHIVEVTDFGQAEDGRVYYVMELLEGEMLGDLLGREGMLPLPRAFAIMAQVAHALAVVHARDIVHRDIKPTSVHIERRLLDELDSTLVSIAGPCYRPGFSREIDHAKIIDFGLVMSPGLTDDPGEVLGTPLYMAPEQIRGNDIDGRTDIYALGILLFEMLTGQPPFVADTREEIDRMHLFKPPPTLKSIRSGLDFPEAVELLVSKALNKDPARRQQTAQEFIGELMACWRSIT